ncbi:MAG: family 43 glycosylhydrolase [Ruminococcus sp.]|nr:family 43 glycosylhydrolase [Ruminococcus sp.]
MRYQNPVIKGFYPDPSVCFANGRYYLVTSSFQYFCGVPLFESSDLVNWKQIGHVLTRGSQLPLGGAVSSGGIYAPTIRFSDGTFYMVTTNTTTGRNFYVTTDDIYGEWSEPIVVAQDGIDPSLYFEDGRAYFMSNGSDDFGDSGITQCEIDIATGRKLSPSKTIWHGSGGRYLESPHLYKIGGWYYLMAAEGGTEYGHMVTCARSREVFGEYETYPHNPVLTNRNLGGFVIQGVGHGDLIRKPDTGEWFIMHLGFRQAGEWEPYHHLGRETFLTPVTFGDDGWFTAGKDGTVVPEFEMEGDFTQDTELTASLGTNEWVYLRNPDMANYELSADRYVLRGTGVTLDEKASPTFIGIRQREFCGSLDVAVSSDGAEAGVSVYMDERHRYDLAIRPCGGGYEAVLRLTIGSSQYIRNSAKLSGSAAKLRVGFGNYSYSFSVVDGGTVHDFGSMETRYLSSEVAGGFTGVVFGLYAVGDGGTGEFSEFELKYN